MSTLVSFISYIKSNVVKHDINRTTFGKFDGHFTPDGEDNEQRLILPEVLTFRFAFCVLAISSDPPAIIEDKTVFIFQITFNREIYVASPLLHIMLTSKLRLTYYAGFEIPANMHGSRTSKDALCFSSYFIASLNIPPPIISLL